MRPPAADATIAHEVNQPLTGIMANAQAARKFLQSATLNLEEIRDHRGIIEDDQRPAGCRSACADAATARARAGDDRRQSAHSTSSASLHASVTRKRRGDPESRARPARR
jgi:hypothetical protein